MKWRLLLFLCLISWGYADQFNIKVRADKAIMINVETGQILYEKKAYERAFPASVTKVATALYAYSLASSLDECVMADKAHLKYVKAAEKIANNYKLKPYLLEPSGVHFWMRHKEEMRLYDLLCGILISSGNDAANVVAAHFGGGSIETFMEGLSEYLTSLGCQDTQFVNPHGLHHPDHYTTAYDLAQMAKEAAKHPEILEITSKMNYVRPKTNRQGEQVTYQKNRLINYSPFHYEKALGLKIGYTKLAQGTFVALAKDEHRTLAVVLLGCPKRNDRYKDAIALFDKAFDEQPESRLLFSEHEPFFSHQIKGAKQKMTAYLDEAVSLTYYPSEERALEAVAYFDELSLPVTQNQRVGQLSVLDKSSGELIQAHPLYASFKVEGTLWFKVKTFMSSFAFWVALILISLLLFSLKRRKRAR